MLALSLWTLLSCHPDPKTEDPDDSADSGDSAVDSADSGDSSDTADTSDTSDTADSGDTGSTAALEAPDDAGDVAFVHNAVAAVLGRPVHGQAELDALLTLEQDLGREALLDALIQEPDYVGYWSRVMTRNFEIDYADAPYYAAFAACTSAPRLFASHIDPDLAQQLSDHLTQDPAASSVPLAWNMTDAMMASLFEDNLLGVYRVWILTRLAWGVTAGDKRSWVLNNSLIHRPEQCAACHNSTWGAPDAGVNPELESYGWDRSWPTALNLDGDVVGGDRIMPLDKDGWVACDESDRGCVVYRDRCASCHGADASTPVNSGGVDGDPTYRPKVLRDRIPVLTTAEVEGTALDGSGRMSSILDRDTESEDATAVTEWLQARFGRREDLADFLHDSLYAEDGISPFGIDAGCQVLIRAKVPPGPVERTYAGQTTTAPTPFHLADALIEGQAALGSATAIDLTSTSDESLTDRRLGGAATFTWMAAESVVDDIYAEVFGTALSTTNGVPRNPVQGAARGAATARFIEAGWSMRGLLKETLLSQHFNRAAPAESVQAEPYPLSMVVNPWSDTNRPPDGMTGEGRNGTGDLTHRFSPDHIQWATARTLGWMAPPLAADPTTGVAWDSVAFQGALGALTGPLLRGEETWTTESLLYWESVVGSCNADGGQGSDWIDALMVATRSMPDATVRDVIEATRDRLLGVSTLTAREEAELARVTPALDALVDDDPQATDALARAWCGAILTSPQFLMTGIPVATEVAPAPRLQVGLAGEPVSTDEWCTHYSDALGAMGIEWSCEGGADTGGDTASAARASRPAPGRTTVIRHVSEREVEAAFRARMAWSKPEPRMPLDGPRRTPMPMK